MELNEFATLLACGSTNTAKNTLSYLIGTGQKNCNWNKALAELYKSFPEDIKTSIESKKEFFPIILKYFETYDLTIDNINIYNDYESFFSAKNKDDLKKNNPQWIWDEEPEIIFKNALDFTNSLPTEYQEKKFDFIKQYESQFSIFAIKQKDKILKHFESKRIWASLMTEDYYKFIELCDKYNFDRISILKENIKSYSDLYNNQIFESDDINYYLEDLTKIGKEYLKVIQDFYPKDEWHITERKNSSNIYSVLLEAIDKKQYKSALKWMIVFDEEFKSYAKIYEVENLHNSKNFKTLLNKQMIILKNRNSSYGMSPHTLQNLLDNNNWFKFMDSFELFENLHNKLIEKNTKVNIKQLKI